MSVWHTPHASQAHQHLALLRLGQVHLLDHQRLAELLQYGGAHLHGREINPPRARAASRSAVTTRGSQNCSR